MEFKDILKTQREKLNLTLEEVGEAVGVSKTTVQRWESGLIKNLRRDKIYALAKVLNVSTSVLMGWNEDPLDSIPGIQPLPRMVKKPRLGKIACGEPILAEENLDGYDDVPAYIDCDFTLLCQGDSMTGARIFDGDVVFIRQQPTVENGEIAAVMIDGETTLKRFYRRGDTVTLMPENPAYEPFTYVNEQLNDIRIIGKAVAFLSKVR